MVKILHNYYSSIQFKDLFSIIYYIYHVVFQLLLHYLIPSEIVLLAFLKLHLKKSEYNNKIY